MGKTLHHNFPTINERPMESNGCTTNPRCAGAPSQLLRPRSPRCRNCRRPARSGGFPTSKDGEFDYTTSFVKDCQDIYDKYIQDHSRSLLIWLNSEFTQDIQDGFSKTQKLQAEAQGSPAPHMPPAAALLAAWPPRPCAVKKVSCEAEFSAKKM